MSRWVVVGGLVAALGCGKGSSDAERGRRDWPAADPDQLAERLNALDQPSTLPELLGALREVCGDGCGCLDPEVAGDALDACVADYNVIRFQDAARPMQRAALAGKYLAAQLRRDGGADATTPLDEAVARLEIIERPAPADYGLVEAEHAVPYTRWTDSLTVIDRGGRARNARLDVLRFDGRGLDDGRRREMEAIKKTAETSRLMEAPAPDPKVIEAAAAGSFGAEALADVSITTGELPPDHHSTRPPGGSAAMGASLDGEPELFLLPAGEASAASLIERLDNASAGFAVAHGGAIARFPIRFFRYLSSAPTGAPLDPLIVELGDAGAVVRTPAGKEIGRAPYGDAAALRAAHQQARQLPAYQGRKDVRVTAGPGVTVAKLIGVLDTLVGDGVTAVGLRTWQTPPLSAPSMRLGEPTGLIPADRETLDQYILYGYKDRITSCYLEALETDPALEGTVTLEMSIDAGGAVTAASATGLSEPLAACIGTAFQGAYLASPRAGAVTVKYPILLRPYGSLPR
jgi:hypothetical protein